MALKVQVRLGSLAKRLVDVPLERACAITRERQRQHRSQMHRENPIVSVIVSLVNAQQNDSYCYQLSHPSFIRAINDFFEVNVFIASIALELKLLSADLEAPYAKVLPSHLH
jgi:hypothetical protein